MFTVQLTCLLCGSSLELMSFPRLLTKSSPVFELNTPADARSSQDDAKLRSRDEMAFQSALCAIFKNKHETYKLASECPQTSYVRRRSSMLHEKSSVCTCKALLGRLMRMRSMDSFDEAMSAMYYEAPLASPYLVQSNSG